MTPTQRESATRTLHMLRAEVMVAAERVRRAKHNVNTLCDLLGQPAAYPVIPGAVVTFTGDSAGEFGLAVLEPERFIAAPGFGPRALPAKEG